VAGRPRQIRNGQPTLQADQLGVDESRAAEIAVFLRPNPQCSAVAQLNQVVGQEVIP
jgi:hypothetical protein